MANMSAQTQKALTRLLVGAAADACEGAIREKRVQRAHEECLALLEAFSLAGGVVKAQAAKAAFLSAVVKRGESGQDESLAKLAALLLSHGADVEEARPDGLRALHVMAKAGKALACKELLARGANPCQADQEGLFSHEHAKRFPVADIALSLSGELEAASVARQLDESTREKSYWMFQLAVGSAGQSGDAKLWCFAMELAGAARQRLESIDLPSGLGQGKLLQAQGSESVLSRSEICSQVFNQWRPFGAKGCSAIDPIVIAGSLGKSSFARISLQRISVTVDDLQGIGQAEALALARAMASMVQPRMLALVELDQAGWSAFQKAGDGARSNWLHPSKDRAMFAESLAQAAKRCIEAKDIEAASLHGSIAKPSRSL